VCVREGKSERERESTISKFEGSAVGSRNSQCVWQDLFTSAVGVICNGSGRQ